MTGCAEAKKKGAACKHAINSARQAMVSSACIHLFDIQLSFSMSCFQELSSAVFMHKRP